MVTQRIPASDLGARLRALRWSARPRRLDADQACRDVNVLAAECCEFASAQAAEDREEDEQPVPAIGEPVGQVEDLAQSQHRTLR